MQLGLLKFFDRALDGVLRMLRPRRAPQPGRPLRRILVIKLSAMGDVLCLMPAVRMLTQAFPQAQVDWLTTRRSAPGLFSSIPFIHRTLVLPTAPLPLGRVLAGLLFQMRGYDLVVDADQYYRISELIAYLGRSSAGFKAPLKGRTFALSADYDAQQSEKLQFKRLAARVIEHHGKPVPAFDVRLPELLSRFAPSVALAGFRDELRRRGRPVVALYAGSSANAAFRRWSIANYVQLARALQERCTLVFAGGPDELSLKEPLAQAGLAHMDCINRWSLQEWAWLFGRCIDLFVGNDGGLLHIAESQDVPVVGIFGPALYAKWGSINPASVAVETDMPCRPCLRNYLGEVPSTCWRGDVACLTGIHVDAVREAVETVLTGAKQLVER